MMVLPMDIARYRAADGHKLRSRHDRGEPAPRRKNIDDFCESRPRLACQAAADLVEREYSIEGGHHDDVSRPVLRSITVAPAASPRDPPPGLADA